MSESILDQSLGMPDNAEAVTPNDTTVFDEPSALYIGTTGNVKVRTKKGNTVTFVNVQDGSWLPILVDKVFTTDTTASDIVRVF